VAAMQPKEEEEMAASLGGLSIGPEFRFD